MSIFTGYAAVFNSPTFIFEGGIKFTESIAPSAFDGTLDSSATVLVRDHDRGRLLGRNTKNLYLYVDSTGLRFNAGVIDTEVSRETAALIEAGVLMGNSFAFRILEESWYEPKKGKPPHRLIQKVSVLHDVAICVDPAYQATSVSVSRGNFQQPDPEQLARRARVNAMARGALKWAAASAAVGRRVASPLPAPIPDVMRGCGHVVDFSAAVLSR